MRTQTGRPLRRRVLLAMVGVAALAVVMFAIPLAIVVQRLYLTETVVSLERDANRVAAVAPSSIASHPVPFTLPRGMSITPRHIGIYSPEGFRILGRGPRYSAVAEAAADSGVHDQVVRGLLEVSAPIPVNKSVVAVVQVATPYSRIYAKIVRAWLLMAGLALLVIGIAAVVARRQSAKLSAPLERLTEDAQALGSGDFTIRTRSFDMQEADAASLALEVTARRLGGMLDRERSFSAHVSHQLRTPLTGFLLGLESALSRPNADLKAVIATALSRGEHLQAIIDDLVRLSRSGPGDRGLLDVAAVLEETQERWRGALEALHRPLKISVEHNLPEVRVSHAAVRQVVDVLVDNAATHGKGDITIKAIDLGTGIGIEVSDDGPGVPDGRDVFARRVKGDGHGIGLGLAQALADAEGGRLVLRRAVPPTFGLLLPATDPARTDSPVREES